MPAERLLRKIRTFVTEQLDAEERALFATLLAPGVAAAHAGGDGDGMGSGLVSWRPAKLPDALAETLRHGGVRIEGLDC
jgi:hypothetical protein